MSVERALLLRVDADGAGLRTLLGDIRSAAARAEKALPGDRVDVIRYEKLSSQLEAEARARCIESCEIAVGDRIGHGFFDQEDQSALPSDASAVSGWIAAGDIAVEIRNPFAFGETPPHPASPSPLRSAADAWQALAEDGSELWGTEAVAKRFKEQLDAAVNQEPDAHLAPSGVANRVLTEGLRRGVGLAGPRRDVPVVYRDGSASLDFPMRCLDLGSNVPRGWSTYRFSMLSIRHTEMDVAVDGAWLRNTVISRPRPAADTDRIAYEISLRQLRRLLELGPTLIYLYQTGLDTAVVGFYRAVTQILLESPGELAVVPMYFRRQAAGHGETIAGYEQQSTFAPGAVWSVR